MRHKRITFSTAAALILAVLGFAFALEMTGEQPAAPQPPNAAVLSSQTASEPGGARQGSLQVLDPASGRPVGECPLKHTSVSADIAGFIARVDVQQEFANPFSDKIEAVYTFPLPHDAAVDDMVMQVGDRTVRGVIKRREEARHVYEVARAKGQVASLLEQERPNIFTQSVANILPGQNVTVKISYVETLKYEAGTYEFTFPMVVEPRFMPGTPIGQTGTGMYADTDKVPDASMISPPVAPKSTRAGHDISVHVSLDAGVPILDLKSILHDVATARRGDSQADVSLRANDAIPNKDFILRYTVAGDTIEDAVLAHSVHGKGGYFALILQPPKRPAVQEISPKEMIFVIDDSGSMRGFPIEKAKETMRLCIEQMHPSDTIQLMSFSNSLVKAFDAPVPSSEANVKTALDFLAARTGSGGTQMLPAIQACLEPKQDASRVRIVCFMTDGCVGNDFQIIDTVQKNRANGRVFSFGIGNSVNRYLLDQLAREGRGEVEYVSLKEQGAGAAGRFYERIANPLLTDIEIDWGGLPVVDVYPKHIPDLHAEKPVIVRGRYTGEADGRIVLKGRCAGQPFERAIPIHLPGDQSDNSALDTLWARAKIDDLMNQDLVGAQTRKPVEGIKDQIVAVALEYRLMTQYTSFVAVEELTITEGGEPRKVAVPVELPDGVSREGIFGDQVETKPDARGASRMLRSEAYTSVREAPDRAASYASQGVVNWAGRRTAEDLWIGAPVGWSGAAGSPMPASGTTVSVNGTVSLTDMNALRPGAAAGAGGPAAANGYTVNQQTAGGTLTLQQSLSAGNGSAMPNTGTTLAPARAFALTDRISDGSFGLANATADLTEVGGELTTPRIVAFDAQRESIAIPGLSTGSGTAANVVFFADGGLVSKRDGSNVAGLKPMSGGETEWWDDDGDGLLSELTVLKRAPGRQGISAAVAAAQRFAALWDPEADVTVNTVTVLSDPTLLMLEELAFRERKDQALRRKLDPALFPLIEKLRKDGKVTDATLGAVEVKGGTAELTLWLSDASDSTIAKLKSFGVQVLARPQSAKLVIARVPVDKIEEIAMLAEVRRVGPFIRQEVTQ